MLLIEMSFIVVEPFVSLGACLHRKVNSDNNLALVNTQPSVLVSWCFNSSWVGGEGERDRLKLELAKLMSY